MKIPSAFVTILVAALSVVHSNARLTTTRSSNENKPLQQQEQQQRKLPALEFLGVNPDKHFPLAECQGDCDTDDECADGLICMNRTPQQAVPGCSGRDSTTVSYCIKEIFAGITRSGTGNGGGNGANGATVLSVTVIPASEQSEEESVTAVEKENSSASQIGFLTAATLLATSSLFFGLL